MEYLPIIGIALLFWLFLIRPTSRRQKELRQMQSSLGVGDDIVLTSGIYGCVREVQDDHLMLEIAPGTTVKVARGAVGSIARRVEDEPAGEPAEDEDQPGASGSEEN